MKDSQKTKKQLIEELGEARQRLTALQALEVERPLHEATLMDSEEDYSKIFEPFPLGVTILDTRGVILYCNAAVYERGGYSKGEFTGKHFSKIASVRVSDIPKYILLFKSIITGKIPKPFEATYQRKDGTTGWTALNISLLKTGGKRRILVIQHDITERKRMEETLQESEENYRTLVEEAIIGIMNVDLTGKITYVNNTIIEATGYSWDELVGKNAFRLGLISSETINVLRQRMKEKLRGQPTGLMEIQYKRKDGEWIWLQIRGSMIRKHNIPVGFQIIGEDITERKQAEEALQESEEKFAAAFRSSPESITISRLSDGKLLEVNNSFLRVTGYTRKDLIGRSASESGIWAKPGDRKRMLKLLKEKGRVSNEEYMIRHKSGEIHTALFSAEKIDIGGEPCIICLAVDITARKQTIERIEHLNLILRAIRNVNQLITREKDRHRLLQGICRNIVANRGYLHTWIALLDESGKLLTHAEAGFDKDFLPVLERLELGDFPPCTRQALEQPAVVITEDPASTCVDCPLLHTCTGGIRALAVRLVYKGKAYGVWSATIPTKFVTKEEVTLFQDMANDISFALHDLELEEDRKQAEEKRLGILQTALDGFWLVNLEGKIIEVNDSYCRMVGYTRKELLKMSIADLEAKEKSEEVAQHINRIIQQGYHRFETQHKRKDGKLIDVEISTNYLNAGEGQFFVFARDITERKRAEEKEHEAETLREIDRLRTELLANISHELRTPLASIKGFATMLIDYEDRLNEDEKREYLETIDKNTDRLVELIEQLLEMSRLEAGIFSIDKVPTDIIRLCREVIEEVSVRAPAHQFTLDMPTRLPLVNADSKRIRQVLDNIIDNSAKYSEEGTEINLAVRRQDPELLFTITDHGIGIPRSGLPLVFNRMFHSPKLSGTVGAGLGLSICKTLVETHGGRIWIESDEGKGTRCFFTLPLDVERTGRHEKKGRR